MSILKACITIFSDYNPTITAPESMANKTYTEVLDTMIEWTEELKNRVRNVMRYGDQAIICGAEDHTDTIKYYDTSKEYVPFDECENRRENKQTLIQSSLYLMVCMLVMVTLPL